MGNTCWDFKVGLPGEDTFRPIKIMTKDGFVDIIDARKFKNKKEDDKFPSLTFI